MIRILNLSKSSFFQLKFHLYFAIYLTCYQKNSFEIKLKKLEKIFFSFIRPNFSYLKFPLIRDLNFESPAINFLSNFFPSSIFKILIKNNAFLK